MLPILYFHKWSPPARSVLLLIKALQIDVDLSVVDLKKGEQRSSEFFKMNPLQKIPVLKHDKLILTDSHGILIYLADTYGPNTDIFGRNDKKKRAEVINRLMFNATFFFKRDGDLFADIIHNQKKDLENHRKGLEEAISFLEIYLTDQLFVAGSKMTIADFSIVATLSTVEMIFPLDCQKFPNVSRWFDQMKSLPFYKEANQEGLDDFQLFLQKLRNTD